MLLLLALLSPCPSQVDPSWTAVTGDGVRIETITKPAQGALVVQTAFGKFQTPLDPVQVVFANSSSASKNGWQALLANNNLWGLHHELARLQSEGSLQQLVLLHEALNAHTYPALKLASADALENWGRRIDDLPRGLRLQDRLVQLWKRVGQGTAGPALLYAGALFEESPRASAGTGARGIQHSELRKGLKSPSPLVRRTAGRIAGRVHIIEPEFLAVLLDASMGADLLASDGAAEGAFACWDVGATSWWTRALLTGSDSMRAQAARNLARHSGPSGLRSLMFFLSAAERKVGSSYAFDGRPIKIVSSSTGLTRWSSTSFVAQKWSQGALLPHPENTLESGSRERIRKVTATNLDACMPWILLATGLPSTTTPEHILNWYDQRKP